jgi:hypothetical protein
VLAQDNEVLFQFFGVFGDAPGHVALRDFVYVARNTQSPAFEPFGDQCQIAFSAFDVLEVPVTMYAARGAFFYHVKKFHRAPKSFRKPPYDRKNRLSEF